MAVLAIDQGTTSTRALLLAPDGSTRITHVVEHRQSYPKPGWVEHDAEELLRNVIACAQSADDVEAIGIDNQGESCLAWDASTGKALSPVVVWQDSRTQTVIDGLKASGAEATVLERSGLPLDAYFSASKLAWLYRSIPDARRLHEQGRLRLGTTDAFFLQRLTGRCVTDVTTASRTSLMNIGSGSWDLELCALFGVPADALPEIVCSTGDFGGLMVGGRTVPLLVSIVDQQAALYGHGCRVAGDAKVTFGTGAFALAVTGSKPLRSPDKGLLPTVAWRKQGEAASYAVDGAVYSAGAAVNWARALGLFSSFDEIGSFDGGPAIARGLVFVPALSGLACPHWDRHARGLWLGMSLDTGSRDLVQAVLEGVAFRTAEVVTEMAALTPISGALSVDGGLVENPYFCQFLADVLERPVQVAGNGELTAFGTAQLAAETLGMPVSRPDIRRTVYNRPLPARFRARFAEAVALARQWPVGSVTDPG